MPTHIKPGKSSTVMASEPAATFSAHHLTTVWSTELCLDGIHCTSSLPNLGCLAAVRAFLRVNLADDRRGFPSILAKGADPTLNARSRADDFTP